VCGENFSGETIVVHLEKLPGISVKTANFAASEKNNPAPMRTAGREAMALALRAAVPICRKVADCLPAAPAQGSDVCEEVRRR
jgi:recombinational DNA repair protein RecR